MDIITVLLKRLGVEVIDSEQGKSDIEKWNGWYKGYLPDFHDYKIFNGINQISCKRTHLSMAKRICEDWASLLLNEKVVISVENEAANKVLQKILKANRFICMGNRLIEMSFALGTGAFVESIRGEEVKIDYVRAEYIYPISVEAGVITECAFASSKIIGNKQYIYIQVHCKAKAGYEITNALFDEDGALVEHMDCEKVLYSPVKLFQIISPNKVNTRNTNTPFGASIFSEAEDVLKSVDVIYDSLINEFMLGKKRIIVPMSMAKRQMTKEGKQIPVFDTNDVAFYALEEDIDKQESIKEIDMELRVEPHIKGLECAISVLSDKCGLGSGRYSVRVKDNAVAVKTATEVVSDKSELWQNIRKHENVLEVELCSLAQAVLHLSGIEVDITEVSVSFDDSIIQDKTAEFAELMQLVSIGAKAPWEVRAWYTGESENEARKICDEIAEGYGDE